ncbi:MAG: hypothetical protein P1U46_01830 [Patescibacteria group bacterium]|nr:hypothetical protein [Patescibacteria group bacterium]
MQCINEYSNNRVVENKLESNLFVPTKTRSEWYKFISYKPEDVNIYKTSWSS